MFVPIDTEIQREVKNILKSHRNLLKEKKNRSGADPFVIALARLKGLAVVTEEPITKNAAKPNIPDVCTDLSVPCMNLLALMKREKWSFKG